MSNPINRNSKDPSSVTRESIRNDPDDFPVDEHDRALLANVRPADWTNPAPADRYDLVVIGAGTGGLVSAAIAVALGARVAMVERNMLGGDCLNVGCVPSKAILRAARAWQAARTGGTRFGAPTAEGDGDFGAAMERMRRIRAEISPVDSAQRFSEMGVDVFLGEARFISEDSVDVQGHTLRFRRAIIASGTQPATPPIDGLEVTGYHTNETIFSLTEQPESLTIIGGGPVGCELAQAFARFGCRVTVLESSDRILSAEDPEASAIVDHALRADGVEVITGARVERAGGSDGKRFVEFTRGDVNRRVTTDQILVAAGRTPNVDRLNLEAADVEYARESGVKVDEHLRTSNRRIYAVGDVTDLPFNFTHVADAHARIATQNALFFGRLRADRLVVPRCTYTSPEVASVSRADRTGGSNTDTSAVTIPLSDVDRAKLNGATDGFLRLHLDSKNRIVSATLVAEQAGEIISHLATVMTAGLPVSALGDTVFPYPTVAEALRKAADATRREKLTPRVAMWGRRYFRLLRRF